MTANHNSPKNFSPKLILPVKLVASGPDVKERPHEDVSVLFCHALEVTPRPSANMHQLHHSAIQLADFLYRYSDYVFFNALLVQLQYLMDFGYYDDPLESAEDEPAGEVPVAELPPIGDWLKEHGFADRCPEAVCKALEYTINRFPYWSVHSSSEKRLGLLVEREYKEVIALLDGIGYWKKIGANTYQSANNAYVNWNLSTWQRDLSTLLLLETSVPDSAGRD